MRTTTERHPTTTDPTAAYAHFAMAQELERHGQLDQALKAYQTAGAPLSMRRLRTKLHLPIQARRRS